MSRIGLIQEICKGKEALDVGCLDMDNSLHLYYKIKRVAKSILGIDINKSPILDEPIIDNFNYEKDNVCGVIGQFDVIVAGEIIEHLNNVGTFLQNCKKDLKPDGKLIITTPNPMSIERIFNHVFFGKHKPDTADNLGEHVAYFNRELLDRLLKRHNFKISKFQYVNNDIMDFDSFIKFRRKAKIKVVRGFKNIFKRGRFKECIFVVARHV